MVRISRDSLACEPFMLMAVVVMAIAVVGSQYCCAGEVLANPVYTLEYSENPHIYRPTDVAWDSDGYSYVLCEGSCEVVVLDESMQMLRIISGKGEGPGEIENPKTIEIVGDKVYIFQGMRLDILSLSGEYVRRVMLGRDIQDTEEIEGKIYCTTKDGVQMMVVLDQVGEIVGEDGPTCPGSTWDERYLHCGNSVVVEFNGRPAIIDKMTAEFMHVDDGTWLVKEFGINTGRSWREGSAVYKTHAIIDACTIDGGRGVMLVYTADGESEQTAIGIVGDDIKNMRVGETVRAVRRVVMSPRGNIWIITWDSELFVFDAEQVEWIVQ